MKQDRFLLGILIGIGLLVAAALGTFLIRREAPGYLPDDTPEGVVHNYALALQKGEYKRAYAYLADTEDKPTLHEFQSTLRERHSEISKTAIVIGEVEIEEGTAWVSVTVIHSGDLFSQEWHHTGEATLEQVDGEWRLTEMVYPYWAWDWHFVPIEPEPPSPSA